VKPSLKALLALATLTLAACGPADAERGRYYWGAEVNVVCPCGARACYWVRAGQDVQSRLSSFVQRQTDSPDQGVYLVYRSHRLDETPVGFAANYDGLIAIDEVLEVSVAVPADCAAR
jgi:hypothetical protein